MPTAMDWARLAAYIDTEGSILMRVQKPNCKPGRSMMHYCHVCVCNTDRRMIDWCNNTFGGFITEQTPNKRLKANHVLYQWHTSKDVGELLRHCLPYMVIKTEQALVAMAFRRTVKKKAYRLSEQTIKEREGCRQLLAELKHKKRGYFEWSIPEDIKHLFYWAPDEPVPYYET